MALGAKQANRIVTNYVMADWQLSPLTEFFFPFARVTCVSSLIKTPRLSFFLPLSFHS